MYGVRSNFIDKMSLTRPGGKVALKSLAMDKIISESTKDRAICVNREKMQCLVTRAVEMKSRPCKDADSKKLLDEELLAMLHVCDCYIIDDFVEYYTHGGRGRR